jgi:hypothetical protein
MQQRKLNMLPSFLNKENPNVVQLNPYPDRDAKILHVDEYMLTMYDGTYHVCIVWIGLMVCDLQ